MFDHLSIVTFFVCSPTSFLFFLMIRRPPISTRTDTLFPTRRSSDLRAAGAAVGGNRRLQPRAALRRRAGERYRRHLRPPGRGLECSGFRGARHRLLRQGGRSEEHTSELQSLMRISYAVFCLKKKNKQCTEIIHNTILHINSI